MDCNTEIESILSDVLADEKVQEMRSFVQHGCVSTYEHCINVAKLSYRINKRFALHCDLQALLIGAMLHDFYLYDWHNDNGEHPLHGFTHARLAGKHAKQYFNPGKETIQIIQCHMWPLNLPDIPRSKEAWVVCIADKCISLQETLFRRKR